MPLRERPALDATVTFGSARGALRALPVWWWGPWTRVPGWLARSVQTGGPVVVRACWPRRRPAMAAPR